MNLNINETLQKGISALKQGKLQDAKYIYEKILKIQSNHPDANHYLGITLQLLGKLDESIIFYKKAISLKPNHAQAFGGLGNALYELNRFEEAITFYKKAINLEPNFLDAQYNLGNALNALGKIDEAEPFYRKTIDLKSNFTEAHMRLNIILEQKKILSMIQGSKKNDTKNKLSSETRLSSNPFISNRVVETELIDKLKKMDSMKLDKTKDIRYGNGRCSPNFKLLENDSLIIKNVSADLNNIMKNALKSEIYIVESFFNILGAGSGTTPHKHLDPFDKANNITDHKYSLVYYLSVGDQSCDDPGILKLYEPDKEILPTNGMIVIIPAGRRHSSVYGGKAERIMIGVNFYSLI